MYNSDMELANQRNDSHSQENPIRAAQQADASAITILLRNAAFTHMHVDWHYPSDWLGSPGFVLQEKVEKQTAVKSLTKHFFGDRKSVTACLAITADPPPAAWVRVAAIGDDQEGEVLLKALMEPVVAFLRETAVTHVGWLLSQGWPQEWAAAVGFKPFSAIETYTKDDLALPDLPVTPEIKLRPVRSEDMDRLAQIEVAAYDPLWRHSVVALRLARQQSFSFDVVEVAGEIVGFQFSTQGAYGAHLARITVDPHFQGRGIGSALLAHAFGGYRDKGLRSVSLNTQAGNKAAHQLYKRFGFRQGNYRLPVWRLDV